jgi:hypothetical protein
MNHISKLICSTYLTLSCLAGNAAELVIGLPAEPNGGNCVPFGCATERYQQVYNSALFSETLQINSVTFFNKNYVPGQTLPIPFEMHLSTTTRAAGELSRTLDENVGSDSVYFGKIAPNTNTYPELMFIGENSFLYDPSKGNLLIEIISSPDPYTPTDTVFIDFPAASDESFSRAYTYMGETSMDFGGLVTGFNVGSVPESSTLLMSAIGVSCLAVLRRKKRCP